ncbi:MAG: hypothetical protein GYA38_10190 [Chloroflexi bacterium]|jgi:hypothetical protein|nr:hypothetical protein [Chloroflexota bacterium]HNW13390.1 hypothetical protein [Anaerolineaceae bacterium]HOE02973.1 hypothetical protein [Anaerolineaceae bacterium]
MMFDIGHILKRAWGILWNYRVLWVFALLLALSGGARGGSGGGGGGGSFNLPATGSNFFENGGEGWLQPGGETAQWFNELEQWADSHILPLFATEETAIRSVIAIVAILMGVSLLIGLLLALVRYPSETAVMRLADAHEQSGTKVKFKEAWRLGWNERAWRVFLVDLLIGAPAFTLVMMLVGLVVWMAYTLMKTAAIQLAAPAVIGIILIALFFVAFAIFMVFVGFLRQYVARYAAIDGLGVGASFKQGWALFKAQFKHTFLLGLVLIGVGLAFGFAMLLAAFLLIPAYILMALPGALVAAIPGGLVYWIASFSAPPVVAVIMAAIVAVPVFVTITFLPVSFLGGMFAVFSANAWTMAFRLLKPAHPPLPLNPGSPPQLPL